MDRNVQWAFELEQMNELGNEFLWVLPRAIDIVSACNDYGKLEGLTIGPYEKLCCGLGGCVWIGWVHGTLLVE
jgi:hypothetical protein